MNIILIPDQYEGKLATLMISSLGTVKPVMTWRTT